MTAESLYRHRASLIARAKDETQRKIWHLTLADRARNTMTGHEREADVASERFQDLKANLLNTARDGAERMELERRLAAEVKDV